MKHEPLAGCWLVVLILASLVAGQGSARCQEIRMPGSFRPVSLFSSKRGDLEIEVLGHRVYLVDQSRKGPLFNGQVIPAQRVYQFEEFNSDAPLVMCLDDQCNLYVMTRTDGQITVRRYSPATPFSPEFRAEMIAQPEAWFAALQSVGGKFVFASGFRLFDKDRLGEFQIVSTDELVPERVKEEQRTKLRQKIVDLLNTKLLTWRENLDEIPWPPFEQRAVRTIQEVWLAKDMRSQQEAIGNSSSAPDEYWHKLRLLNRIVLGEMLGRNGISCDIQSLVPPAWSVKVPGPGDGDEQHFDPGEREALATLYATSGKCVIEITPDGNIGFTDGGKRLPVVLDAKTGKLIEPMQAASLRLQDVPVREGALYRGRFTSPFDEQFALQISSYNGALRSFTGLIHWGFCSVPNRVRGEYRNGVLSWLEYRNVDGVEIPGALYTATNESEGSARLTFSIAAPDLKLAKLECTGSLDMLPRRGNDPAVRIDNEAGPVTSFPSPYAGRPFPEMPDRVVVYPYLPEFVKKLLELGPVTFEVKRRIRGGGWSGPRRGKYVVLSVNSSWPMLSYCGLQAPPTGTKQQGWEIKMVPQSQREDIEIGQRITGGDERENGRLDWRVDGDTLSTCWAAFPLPEIPCVLYDEQKGLIPPQVAYTYYLGKR